MRVLGNRTSTVSDIDDDRYSLSVVAEQCLCEYLEEQKRQVEEAGRVGEVHSERTSATMATARQVQEALKQLQAQEARVAVLETQQQIEETRVLTAEQERSALMTTLKKGTGKGKMEKDQKHMSNVKYWNCGKFGHYWRDCKEKWWSEEKAISKGRLNSAESSNWQEGRLGGRSQSYREQDEEHAI